MEFTASQIRAARDLYKELFGLPADGTEARVLGGEWAESLRKLSDELNRVLAESYKYPFVSALEPFRAQIIAMLGKPAAWYITEPVKDEDALLNAKEDILDKVRSFMGGAQREIYDDVREFLQGQDANIGYVDAQSGDKLRAALANPECYKGTAIQALKSELYALKDKVELAILKERKAVVAAVDECAEKVIQTAEFAALTPDQQDHIRRSVTSHKEGLDAVSMIPILRDRANGARTGLMQQLLGEIARMTPPPAPPPGSSSGGGVPPPAPPPPAYVNASEIKVAYSRPYLAEEADVDEYVSELRKTLMSEIVAGKKVIV